MNAALSSAPPALPGSYLVVELTNRCSLKCVHCSVSESGHGHHQHTGYLDAGLFEDLVADLVATGARFDALILFWLGEPLLHPHFGRIWRAALRAAARHQTFGKVELHSNGTHLTADRADVLLNDSPVPQVLHLSLDAATQETYLRVKGIDRFDQVEANVEAFLERKAARNARWPRVVFQFIVGSNNVTEARPFQTRWSKACTSVGLPVRSAAGHVPPGNEAVVFYRQLDCPTAEEQQRENALFREEMRWMALPLPEAAEAGVAVAAENLSACSGFWKSPVVSWQGEVTACTRDNLLENSLGSLRDQPFSSLWFGAEMAARRERVACGDYSGLSLCSTCFIPKSLNHSELSQDDIARQAAWDAVQGGA